MKSLVLINYFLREDKMNDNIINALVKAQNEIGNAHKDAKNPFFKSNYATLESVIEAVKQPLLDQGVLFLQKSDVNETGVSIETVFYGHGGEISTGKLYVPADKRDPQGYGSALTYARRYSLAMACGIGSGIKVEETGFDDDANSANKAVRKQAKAEAPKKVIDNMSDEDLAKTDKVLQKSGFVFRNGEGVPINAVPTPSDYIQTLRNNMSDLTEEQRKELFNNNNDQIQKAYEAVEEKDLALKESYKKLMSIYDK